MSKAQPGARTMRRIRVGLLVLNLLAIALCAAMLRWRWQAEVDHSELQASNTAALLARGAGATLDKAALAVAGVADQVDRALSTGAIDPRMVWPMVDKAAARVPELQTIGVFDHLGQQVCGIPADRCRRLSVADRDYFAMYEARPAAPPELFGPVPSRLDGQPVLVLAKGIEGAAGGFGGVAIALLPIKNLAELVGTASLGPKSVASLRTALDFTLLARAPALPADKLGAQAAALSAQLRQVMQQSPEAGVVRAQSAADGETRVNAYRRLIGYPVYAFVADAADDSLAAWRESLWWTVGFLIVFAVSSVAIERVATRSHREQTRAQRLYDEAPCGYHTLSAEGKFLSVNATELSWLGCARDEVLGKLGPRDFVDDEGRATFADNFPRLVSGQPLEGLEVNLLSRDGAVRRVAISATAVFDRAGRFVSTNSVMHDITPRRRAEEARVRAAEVEAQNTALRESARLKDQFLATMSHELRTPLNAVIGFSQLLGMGAAAQDDEKRARYVQRIGESGRHLLGLVETLLDFGKLEASKLAFNPSSIDVRSALEEVAGLLMPKQLSEGVTIRVEVAPELDTVVNDPLRLRQMLLNLADNAVKFSRRGGTVEIRARGVDAASWRVEVEDHGIGIKPEDIGRLFQTFVQLSEGNTRAHGGTGLGLSLVRQIARAQAGDITVRSAFGEGSVFTLTLPRTI